jgi:hypothetical protein
VPASNPGRSPEARQPANTTPDKPAPARKRQPDEADDRSLEDRLRAFYQAHQPSLIDRAPKIAQLYRGREEALNANLSSTYGADLTTPPPRKGGGEAPPAHTLSQHIAPPRNEPAASPYARGPDAAAPPRPPAAAAAPPPAGSGGGGKDAGAVLPPWAKPLGLQQFLRVLRRDAFVPDILSVEQVRRVL